MPKSIDGSCIMRTCLSQHTHSKLQEMDNNVLSSSIYSFTLRRRKGNIGSVLFSDRLVLKQDSAAGICPKDLFTSPNWYQTSALLGVAATASSRYPCNICALTTFFVSSSV